MTEDRIFYLLQAYTNRVATQEEEQELFRLVASTGDDRDIKAYIKKLINDEKQERFPQIDWETVYRKILEKAEVNNKSIVYKNRGWYKIAAAAVLILVMGAGAYFFWGKRSTANKPVPVTLSYHDDIEPGTTKAIFSIGDERVKLYGRDTSFELGGNEVHVQGGKLNVNGKRPNRYTVMTPRGADYRMVLPDGTAVWLNADSRLTYLSDFDKDSREVQLTGEAYFNVHTDAARPFIVNTPQQRIQVLGTEFNVQAYSDEKAVTTTLVQGKIRVNSANEKVLLKSGQQVSNGSDGRLQITPDADIEQIVAWKNGYFRFEKTDIHTIMDQLSRWYDVDVVYKGNVPNVYFGALIGRNNNISQILKLLEATGDIHFEISGRTVTVIP